MRLSRQVPQTSRILLFLIFIICIVSFSVISPRFFAYAVGVSATIQLSETSGPPTSFTKVTGKNFGTTETVKLLFDTKLDGTTTTSSTGTFTFSLKIPRMATPGTHTIKAIGQSSQHSATASFLVQTNWSQGGFDAAQTHFNPYENVISASNVSQSVIAWENNYSQAARGTPIVVNDRVFITADNFYALNATTGTTIWSSSAFGSATAPAVVGGIIYLASDKLYAVNAKTGVLLWTDSLNGGSDGSPTVAHGVVYVTSYNGTLYAFNAQNGKQLWSVTPCSAITATPAIANGLIYVGCTNDILYALATKTGTTQWTFTAKGPIYSSVAIANGLVYVSDSTGVLSALNALTGTVMWSATTLYGQGGTPAIAGNTVFVNGNGLFAFNAITGVALWSTLTDTIIGNAPSVANGVVYVILSDGPATILALDARTGANLWSYDLSPIASFGSPSIVNGMVYIGEGSTGQFGQGNLYAFHIPSA